MAWRKSKMSPKSLAKAYRDAERDQKRVAASFSRAQTRKKWRIPANVVLTFMRENRTYLPDSADDGLTIEEIILRAREALWRSKVRYAHYVALSRSPVISEATLIRLLEGYRLKGIL